MFRLSQDSDNPQVPKLIDPDSFEPNRVWDKQRFVDTFKCAVCKGVVIQPLECTTPWCTTLICENCIKTQKNEQRCPSNCGSYNYHKPNKHIMKHLLEQKFKCKNHPWCQEISPYSSYEKHLKECKVKQRQCDNPKCLALKQQLVESEAQIKQLIEEKEELLEKVKYLEIREEVYKLKPVIGNPQNQLANQNNIRPPYPLQQSLMQRQPIQQYGVYQLPMAQLNFNEVRGLPISAAQVPNTGNENSLKTFVHVKEEKKAALNTIKAALEAAVKANAEQKKDKDADPCKGKAKEFFIYEYDDRTNVCKCNAEQLAFIAIHYPEHFDSPVDILMWLYDQADYRDDLKEVEKTKLELIEAKKKQDEAMNEGFGEDEESIFVKLARQKEPQKNQINQNQNKSANKQKPQDDEIDYEEQRLAPKSFKEIQKEKKKQADIVSQQLQMKNLYALNKVQKDQGPQKKLNQIEEKKNFEEEKEKNKNVRIDSQGWLTKIQKDNKYEEAHYNPDPEINQYNQKGFTYISMITRENQRYKSIAAEFIYGHVEKIVGKEQAPLITGKIIDLPINVLKDCIYDYEILLLKTLNFQSFSASKAK